MYNTTCEVCGEKYLEKYPEHKLNVCDDCVYGNNNTNLLNKYAKNKITKDKFIITSELKDGKVGVKKLNPCNGKFRSNAKEIFISIEKLEIL